MFNIAVAGTGYVGLVTGVCLAEIGNNITCIDINESKIESLKKCILPIYEEGLEDLLKRNYSIGRINFTTDYKDAYKNADIIFIAVGTPERKDGSANLSYVYKAAREIAHSIEKDCVVVIKSTVPIGTNDKIEALIRSELTHNVNVDVASNPEFLSQGTAVKDTMCASRIVIGVENKHVESILKKVFEGFINIPILVTNRRSAEMIKYASNDFLALKISYINEIANLCEIVGADIQDVTKGMGYDNRIGNKFLNAGVGYGGSCFPKDTKALHWLANYHDYELKTIKSAIEINEQQKLKLIKKARKYYESFENIQVAVLGLTFKPGTDDIREAPSLVNLPILLEDGAIVRVWDPIGIENTSKAIATTYADYNAENLIYCKSIEEAITDADICLIFTEWDEIVNFDLLLYKKLMKKPIIIDGRNCYSLDNVKMTGITYESIGRKVISGSLHE